MVLEVNVVLEEGTELQEHFEEDWSLDYFINAEARGEITDLSFEWTDNRCFITYKHLQPITFIKIKSVLKL